MLGLAVISGNVLVDFHLQPKMGTWTPRKKEQILASLQPWFSSYNIKSIALSIPYEKQTSSQTKEVLESFKTHFAEKDIPFHPYPPKAFRTFFDKAKPKAKKEMLRNLALQYPELEKYYEKERRNKNKYYIKLFEAVAVALLHANQLEKKR